MSEITTEAGRLSIMSTPIGNLEDMTYRAVRTLGEADLVAAEDTRRAQKLLNHFDVKVKTVSYHSHNEHQKTEWLLDQVENGLKVVVLSDAGTPCIADPGFLAVREAVKRSIEPAEKEEAGFPGCPQHNTAQGGTQRQRVDGTD